ncbi:MFS transporter [Pseudarthrobacter polychromogenes]|uniref:MFS transporter n=1 Tax=Pseudarthrobacter polychromogenes TaxID=1676 RepID=A0ABQ1Y008_9MICC|nr:MFS transporter [Pseudarthrobacter polychromogenes]GGH07913.1 MFS transporter [Pseudarthrobacter polychromogenes]
MSETITATKPARVKSPRGYVGSFALSSFGIYVALLAPVYGGLSVKIQEMSGLDAAPALLGLLTGAGALFSTLVQPVAGRLSDRTTSRFGMRRPFILAGGIGTAIFLVLSGMAPNYPLLLISWCFVQLCANFALAAHHTTLADQVPEAKRGGVSGIIGAVTPAAILGGALFLTLLPTTFLRFTVPAIFGLITIIVFVIVLKDKVRTDQPTTKMDLKQILGSYVFHPRTYPDFGWAWLSKALVLLGFGATSTYITLFLGAEFGMDTAAQLKFNALAQAASIGTLVIFSILGGYLSDKVGRRKPFVLASGIVLGLGVILIAVSPTFGAAGLTVLLVAQGIIGMGAGTFFAVDQALCISVLPHQDEMAKDLGILNLAGTLPGVLAPLFAGVVFIPLGNALFGGGYGLWFTIAGVIAMIGGLLVLKIKSVK